MKYCSHCGTELLDDAVICPKCGCWVNPAPQKIKEKLKYNICALLGFILAIVGIAVSYFGAMSLAGMILSIIGLVQLGKVNDRRGKGLAIAGIAVGALFFVEGLMQWIGIVA